MDPHSIIEQGIGQTLAETKNANTLSAIEVFVRTLSEFNEHFDSLLKRDYLFRRCEMLIDDCRNMARRDEKAQEEGEYLSGLQESWAQALGWMWALKNRLVPGSLSPDILETPLMPDGD